MTSAHASKQSALNNINKIIPKNETEGKSKTHKNSIENNTRARSISPFGRQVKNNPKANENWSLKNKKMSSQGQKYNNKKNFNQLSGGQSIKIKNRKINIGRKIGIKNNNSKDFFSKPKVKKSHYESVEDSILEENISELNWDSKFSQYSNGSPTKNSQNINAYYSDGNKGSSKFIAKIQNSQASMEMKSLNYSFATLASKWKYPIVGNENSGEQSNILVNDNDQLHVIKEWKPRKSKAGVGNLKKKERRPLMNNYKKRAYDIERKKRAIQQIEDKFKEYTFQVNPFKTTDKRGVLRNKGISLEANRASKNNKKKV